MILDLNDPDSILAWFRVWSARHGPHLADIAARNARFAPAIAEAGRRARAGRSVNQGSADHLRSGPSTGIAQSSDPTA